MLVKRTLGPSGWRRWQDEARACPQIDRDYGNGVKIEAVLDYAAAVRHLHARFKLNQSEQVVLASATTTTDLIDLLSKTTTPTERQSALKAHMDKFGSPPRAERWQTAETAIPRSIDETIARRMREDPR